jgi:hypothetical protein
MKEIPRERLLGIIQHAIDVRSGRTLNGRAREDDRGLTQCAFEIAFEFDLNQENVLRSLRRFVNGDQQYIRIGTADQWLTGLGLQHLWRVELSDIYDSI